MSLRLENRPQQNLYDQPSTSFDDFCWDDELKKILSLSIGSLATKQANIFNSPKTYKTLPELIESSRSGDESATNYLKLNIAKDTSERLIKFGHISSPVYLEINPDSGRLEQYAQDYLEIHSNALMYHQDNSLMFPRSRAEYLNALRIVELNRLGLLEDNGVLIISLAEDSPENGFYTKTMTCSLQWVTQDNGKVKIETAFVGGKDGNDERHDLSTVKRIYETLGYNIDGLSAKDILANPLVFSKKDSPEGLIGHVKLWDKHASSSSNVRFFGTSQNNRDYLKVVELSRHREKLLEATNNNILEELLCTKEDFDSWTNKQINAYFNELSEYHSLMYAINDLSIDPEVFGLVSAKYIVSARKALVSKDIDGVRFYTNAAILYAVSNSCPNGLTGSAIGSFDDRGSTLFLCPYGHLNSRVPYGELKSNCDYCGMSVAC